MTRLALIRHALTEWNMARRIQGQTDVPLSPDGRRQATEWRLPASLTDVEWYSSPLSRAVETACLLGAANAARDARLREMSWGRWEGRRLADLRVELGPPMAASEGRGLDFRPPGGESPRDVQVRAVSFLADVAVRDRPAAAVSHKGFMRAVLALALGWDMKGRAPISIDWRCAQVFDLNADGTPRPEVSQLSLEVDR